MAVQETVDISINNSQAIASLRNIERSVDLLANGFRDFISGVAEGMTSALRDTNKVNTGINNMRRSVDNLNNSVAKSNIATKFGTDIARSTQAMSQLSNRVSQTGKQLLGLESIIGAFAITNLVRGAADYAKETAIASGSSYQFLRAQQALTENTNNFYKALLSVIQPLSETIAKINVSASAFESLIKAVLAGGAAFLFFSKLLQPIIKLLGNLGTILIVTFTKPLQTIKVLASALGGILLTGLSSLFSPLVKIIQLMTGIFVIFKNAGVSIVAFTSAWRILVSGFISAITVTAKFAVRFAGVIGIVYAIAEAVNFLSKVFFKFDMFDWLGDKISSVIDKLKEFIGLRNKANNLNVSSTAPGQLGRFGMTPEQEKQYLKTINDWETKRADILANTSNIIKDDLDNFIRQNDAIRQQLALENKMFGMSQDSIDVAKLRLQFEQQRIQAIADLERKIRDLGPEETAAGAIALYRQQIETYKKLSFAAENAQIVELKALQRKRAEQDAFNKQLEYATQMYDQQIQRTQTLANILQGVRGQTADVLFEREQMGRGPIQQQIARAYEDARKSALEAQRQFAESFGDTGDGMTPERMAELQRGLDQISQAFQNLAYQTENNILISQQWSTGWSEAFNTFVDNALNAADRAREVFNSIVGNMENALDNFVRTGKLNFRDLVESILKDLTSIALRKAFRDLLMMGSSGGGGGGGLLATLGSFFAGFFAQGGFIPPGKAGIVGERGPELVSGPAQVTPLTGAMAPVNNYYTYNINALDAKSVAQLFAENRRTLLGVTEQARKEMPIRQRF